MSYLHPIRMVPAAMTAIAILTSTIAPTARANETVPAFAEHRIEFHNQTVKLAGSLLLPRSDVPVPAVVFVHGAGRQTREPYREVGEYFASHGIAALIYDKRGTGQSTGDYESREPYENLINDALAAVALLKQRPEIAASPIGIWGLSQGADISAVAASRSADIRFIMVAGASVADGTMSYYRDNLFRRYGLSDKLRDVAEKAQLAQSSLPYNSRRAWFTPRSYPPPDQYVHPAWSHVHQPVLAMWGQLDQNVPVGESVAGLKNSLAHANNAQWTIVILPGASHSLGASETGALYSGWRGYAPGALKTMTDWASATINHPALIDKMKQEGNPRNAGILPRLTRYERLRWYGNGTVQATLWISFLILFLANTIAGVRGRLFHLFPRQNAALPASNIFVKLKRATCALNLLILITFSTTVWLALDQLHPTCPSVMPFIPCLGTVSTLATVVLLIVFAKTPRHPGRTATQKFRPSLELLCLTLFVPYMFYWDLIGYRF